MNMTVKLEGSAPQAPELTEEQARNAYAAIVEGLSRNYGYSHPDNDREEALAVHEPVRQGAGADWPSGPVLCRDFEGWTTTTAWAVVWEGGPYDWAMYVPAGGRTEEFGLSVGPIELPHGIWVEPINGWALGLYVHEGPVTVPGLAEPMPGSGGVTS